jgi:hypothetical protein
MPAGSNPERERQYEHIEESRLERGTGEKRAAEIAARTANEKRARHGESRTANRSPRTQTHRARSARPHRAERMTPVPGGGALPEPPEPGTAGVLRDRPGPGPGPRRTRPRTGAAGAVVVLS